MNTLCMGTRCSLFSILHREILARQAVAVQIKLNYTLTQPRMNLGEFSAREILARQAVGVQIKLNYTLPQCSSP